MHTSRRDAFQTINSQPLGTVNIQTDKINENLQSKDGDYKTCFELNENVGFLKARPGLKTEEIEFLIEQDYDGVLIEGTGLGHLPVNNLDDNLTRHHEKILEKIGELAENTLVVMSSQCINGRIDMDVYDTGLKIKENNVIEAQDMHPETAYVKLIWTLGQTNNLEEAEKLFKTNINGEITDRTLYSEEK